MSPAGADDAASASEEREFPKATFAGGCFWCMQALYDALEGVVSTTVGYTGGDTVDPSYEEVSRGDTGHAEAVRIVYDPSVVSYAELLRVFWRNIDPLDASGQFCDKGRQYRSAIFYHDETQRRLAEETKQALAQSPRFHKPIVTEIAPASEFYAAEDYHQSFYRKSPLRYNFYRFACGRDRRLAELWG